MLILKAVACCVFITCTAVAASPDYFPLDPGNEWVYRCTGLCAEPLRVLRLSRLDYVGGKWYSIFEGFGGSRAWLRQDEQGAVWALDRATSREERWYSFFSPLGESYETSVDPCSRRATIASRSYRYEGPAGVFPETLQILYPQGPCADAGLTEEIFLPWTGLVRRTEATIGGPRTYDLIYARTGGVTVISQPELHSSLTLDKSVYTANVMPPIDPATSIPKMTARLTIRNTTDQPLTLDFPGGGRLCLEVTEAGNSMSTIACRVSTLPPATETIAPGEKNYIMVLPLGEGPTRPLRAGKYTVRAWLTTNGEKAFSASMGFEVRHAF